jgi:hypothetical protein
MPFASFVSFAVKLPGLNRKGREAGLWSLDRCAVIN